MPKSNNTPLNLLASFAYLGRNKSFCSAFFNTHRNGTANCMIDSGAFTKLNAKEARSWLTLDSYCDFLGEYQGLCEKYVSLDVIGNEKATKQNYETMVHRGLSPMFVLTMFDNDWTYLKSTMRVNRHCCVAGGTMTKGPWLIKRFQDAVKHTDGEIQIHGLGYVTYPNILRAPIVSGDSSSWDVGARKFGNIRVWTMKGVQGASYREYWDGKKMPLEVRRALDRIEVTPAEFVKKSNNCGGSSIGYLLSILAYLEFQRFAYRYGRRLFLAVNSESCVQKILWANENFNHCTFADFRKEFGKI